MTESELLSDSGGRELASVSLELSALDSAGGTLAESSVSVSTGVDSDSGADSGTPGSTDMELLTAMLVLSA